MRSFRVDTDAGNKKMRHILLKNNFTYCGTIWFGNSEKLAFDKNFQGSRGGVFRGERLC